MLQKIFCNGPHCLTQQEQKFQSDGSHLHSLSGFRHENESDLNDYLLPQTSNIKPESQKKQNMQPVCSQIEQGLRILHSPSLFCKDLKQEETKKIAKIATKQPLYENQKIQKYSFNTLHQNSLQRDWKGSQCTNYSSAKNLFKLENNNHNFFNGSLLHCTKEAQNYPMKSNCQQQYYSQEDYNALLRQNNELKRIVREQYYPMRQSYQRLKKEQNVREQLVSNLQGKVRQLAQEMQMLRSKQKIAIDRR